MLLGSVEEQHRKPVSWIWRNAAELRGCRRQVKIFPANVTDMGRSPDLQFKSNAAEALGCISLVSWTG
jgi:hypothetical protein